MRLVRIVSGILAGAALAACSHAAGPSSLPPVAGPLAGARPDAGGFKLLYTFKLPPDAESPVGGLAVLGGTLYGTSQAGGQGESGAVFAVTTAGKEHVVHSFGAGHVDGVFPMAGLVVLGGTFYGTTLLRRRPRIRCGL